MAAAVLAGTLGVEANVSPARVEAAAPAPVREIADASMAAPRQTAPAEAPCPARDPEDGLCYPSADAADLAWIARGRSAAPRQVEPAGAEDDEDEGEDAGTIDVESRLSFWTNVASTVRALVVRKGDSRPVSLPEDELAELFSTGFPLPLELFPSEKFRDTFDSRRGRHRRHHAIDLPAPRGTPVVAVADGVIERLGRDRKGGKVVYLRDTTGKFTFYYAHLRAHEKGLKTGGRVTRGQRLGEVGATGHIIGGPHLHFAIFRHGKASDVRAFVVNPYLVLGALIVK